jgi:hypothetical protein
VLAREYPPDLMRILQEDFDEREPLGGGFGTGCRRHRTGRSDQRLLYGGVALQFDRGDLDNGPSISVVSISMHRRVSRQLSPARNGRLEHRQTA